MATVRLSTHTGMHMHIGAFRQYAGRPLSMKAPRYESYSHSDYRCGPCGAKSPDRPVELCKPDAIAQMQTGEERTSALSGVKLIERDIHQWLPGFRHTAPENDETRIV